MNSGDLYKGFFLPKAGKNVQIPLGKSGKPNQSEFPDSGKLTCARPHIRFTTLLQKIQKISKFLKKSVDKAKSPCYTIDVIRREQKKIHKGV